MSDWEHYTQDDYIVTIERIREGRLDVRCDCGWSARGRGEADANNLAMEHVLEHDIRYEESEAAS